jgi:general stress protein 26
METPCAPAFGMGALCDAHAGRLPTAGAAERTRKRFCEMDSINANQPEHNREDLSGEAAIARIKQMIGDSPNCFFCTEVAMGDSNATRPMNVRKVDDQGNLWFLSSTDSHKNMELERSPKVRLYFQGSKHSDFLELEGIASLCTDKAKIEELWDPMIRTWFTEGKDDPRITVIKFEPKGGYYWDTKHGSAIAGIKMMIGAAIGMTLDDSIEGRLRA